MTGTDNNVTNGIIQMIPRQSEPCVMMLSITVYETTAIHCHGPQNIQKYDTIIFIILASRGTGTGRGRARCMARQKSKI